VQEWLQNNRAWLQRYVGYGVAALVLFFLSRILLQSRDELAAYSFDFRVNYGLLMVALVLNVIGLVLSVEIWRQLLLELDGTLTFRQAFRLWFFSLITRYIPGNVWQPATLVILGEREGITKGKTIFSQALFLLLTLAVAGVISLSLLPSPMHWQQGALFFSLAAIVFFAIPPVFRGTLRLLARVSRYDLTATRFDFLRSLLLLGITTAMWIAYGLSLYFFIGALGVIGELTWLHAIAVFAGAYLIGFLSFLTPSGLGVREGTMAFFLSAYMPLSLAIVIALLARLLAIAAELVCLGMAWLTTRIR